MALSPVLRQLIARVEQARQHGIPVAPIPETALASPLSMRPEDVAARMDALGFRTPVFHSTRSQVPIDEFRLNRSTYDPKDIPAVHVGTEQAAADRAAQWQRISNPEPQHTMPLVARMGGKLLDPSGKPYSEFELGNMVDSQTLPRVVDEGLRKGTINPADILGIKQGMFREELLAQGLDTVPYINHTEDPGSTSYMILQPQNLRSVFAQFDPAKSQLANIMAGRALALAGGGAAAATAGYAAADRGGSENT